MRLPSLPSFIQKPLQRSITAIAALALIACGGGVADIAGGVGSGGSGVAEGSITGFGSVIVDGVTYEDTNASVVSGNALGTNDQVQAKLGQRVRISQSRTGVADQIIVLPQMRGTADSAADSNGWFQMLGQWVRIISVSDTQNNATVLDGLSSVASGNPIEVHGAWVFDSSKNASVLVASRIEKLAASPDPVLLSGVVSSRSDNTITLNSANGSTLQYASLPSSIGAQSLVSAWIPLSALSRSPWVATRLSDASPQITGNQSLLLGTQVSARDVAQGTVVVQGLSVKLPSSLIGAPPALGAPVQLEIVRDNDGWRATTVTQRKSESDLGGTVELKGSIVWPAQLGLVVLRDVRVQVAASSLDKSCTGIAPGSLVYVSLKAQRSPAGQALQAIQVACNTKTPSNGVIEISGQLVQLSPAGDGSSGTLVVEGTAGRQSFQWTSLSLLPKGLSSLINQTVEVEYQVVNGENRLRRIKAD